MDTAWRAGRPDGEAGQVLVIFALSLTALVGLLALVVDAGLVLGQRRYAQNGADAAALAAARLLIAAPTAPDLQVYQEVRRYAGLSPSDLTASVPPAGAFNVPGGLAGRLRQAATLEYDNGAGWCVAAGRPAPPRTPAPPVCATAPPPFDAARPYRVRVTVSSTLEGFFARAVGLGDLAPPPPTTDAVPACLRPAGARGITTCAHATVTVREGPGPHEYAIFAGATGCGTTGLSLSGTGKVASGAAHSNSRIVVTGNEHQVQGALTVGCPLPDAVSVSGARHALPAPAAAGVLAPPVSYALTDFPCTHYFGGAVLGLQPSGPWYADTVPPGTLSLSATASPLWLDLGAGQLHPGVYCANGDISISSSAITGTVTFVATGRISISGNGHRFTPYHSNVLAVALGGGNAVAVSGGDHTWSGIVYAPNGSAAFTGGATVALTGAVVASTVTLSGGDKLFDGTGYGVRARQRTAHLTE